jgi:hypothetical protein
VFQNRLLRRVFRPKGEEVAGSWRSLHNEELHNLYSLPNMPIITVIQSRRMGQVRHVVHVGKIRNAYKISVGEHNRRRPLRRLMRRWEDNIRMDLEEIGYDDVNWVHLIQDMEQWLIPMNKLMNLPVPYKAGNF